MATRSSDFKLHSSNFTLFVFFLLISCSAAQAALQGGCGKIDITPPLGITLIGSKGYPSDSIRDNLFAKAIVLSDGAETIAIVSTDLLYTPS